MKIERVSLDGDIKDANDSLISTLNQGFQNGLGVFETFRVTDGKVFLLNEHFARLQKSLEALGVKQIDGTKAKKQIQEIASSAHEDHDARIRFCVTPENTIIYLSSIKKHEPNSKQAKILKTVVRHQPEYFGQTGFRLKSFDYSYVDLAKKEIKPDQDGIMLSPNGYVAEALTSNIFWTKNDEIFTSPAELGILQGVIRAYLLDEFKIIKNNIRTEDLLEADEIFLTNSIDYLCPLDKINEIKKPGLEGRVFMRLNNELTKAVNSSSRL